MGYMRHHAIVVTGDYGDYIENAHSKAAELFFNVSGILESPVNGYKSFFIPPDGSKEGWAQSDDGDKDREEFVNYLNSLRYEDGSSPLDWAELFYGDDNGDAQIVNHSGDIKNVC